MFKHINNGNILIINQGDNLNEQSRRQIHWYKVFRH